MSAAASPSGPSTPVPFSPSTAPGSAAPTPNPQQTRPSTQVSSAASPAGTPSLPNTPAAVAHQQLPAPAPPPPVVTEYAPITAVKRKRLQDTGYSPAEIAEVESRAAAFDLALALDQDIVLNPPKKPKAFTSFGDAVEQLLPYHVFQIHEDDLLTTEKKTPQQESQEAQLAKDVVERISNIQDRFANIRRREGHHASDLPSLITLLQASTQVVREELQGVQAELRTVRQQWDVIDAEHRRKQQAIEEAQRKEREQREAAERARQNEIRRQQLLAAERERLARQQQLNALQQQQQQQQQTNPTAAAAPSPAAVPPAAQASLSAPGTPAPPAAPVGAAVSAATPTATPPPASPEPGTPPAVRGRPRGRPRGSGRGGVRPPVTPHIASPVAQGARPPAPASTAAKQPVIITVAMATVQQFVNHGILVIPPVPGGPKPPASVVRTSEDKKQVILSIDLSACNQTQLQALARILGVHNKLPGAANATGTASSSASAAVAGAAAGAAAGGGLEPTASSPSAANTGVASAATPSAGASIAATTGAPNVAGPGSGQQ